jgi:hypothetical protein
MIKGTPISILLIQKRPESASTNRDETSEDERVVGSDFRLRFLVFPPRGGEDCHSHFSLGWKEVGGCHP